MATPTTITIKHTTLVKPAEPTWSGRMSLSEWDMIGAITHVPTVFFYRSSTSTRLRTTDSGLLDHLKDSLARTLVTFYPLAGRLEPIGRGRFDLDCNGLGVLFIEAEAQTTSLDDLGDLSCCTDFQPLIPEVDYDRPIGEWPLLLVQVTKFRCGGIGLGFSISHAVVDGLSALHFKNEWARVTRGEGIGTAPYLDRGVLRAGLPPVSRQPRFDPAEFQRPPVLLPDVGCSNNKGAKPYHHETTVAKLKMTKTKVQMLKDMANAGGRTPSSTFDGRPFSTYETLTAHTWRCACKARKLRPDQPTSVGVCVDSRRRTSPPLPDAYFGNAVLDVKAAALAGDVVARPLGFAAGKIRKAVEKADSSEFLSSAVDYLKNQPDLSEFQDFHAEDDDDDDDVDDDGPFFGMPNLGVISWLRLPMVGLDFGFGKEVYMGSTHEFDGDTMLLPGRDGDGAIVVAICLRVDHMEAFKRCFYGDIVV